MIRLILQGEGKGYAERGVYLHFSTMENKKKYEQIQWVLTLRNSREYETQALSLPDWVMRTWESMRNVTCSRTRLSGLGTRREFLMDQAAERDSNNPPLLLLPEALGFVPQLLLDDIINIANDAVGNGIKGLEGYLQGWANQRAETKEHSDWDGTSELEQGLGAVETLLEHHTDIAFDVFEAWSLRNIFAIPNDLPYVLPHQDGLDLTQTPESEQELIDEIEELRAKLEDVRIIFSSNPMINGSSSNGESNDCVGAPSVFPKPNDSEPPKDVNGCPSWTHLRWTRT